MMRQTPPLIELGPGVVALLVALILSIFGVICYATSTIGCESAPPTVVIGHMFMGGCSGATN